MEKSDGELGWWHRYVDGDSVLPRIFAGQRHRLDGSEQSSYAGPNVEYYTAQGDTWGAEAFVERERIAQAFELLPGVTVPAGEQR